MNGIDLGIVTGKGAKKKKRKVGGRTGWAERGREEGEGNSRGVEGQRGGGEIAGARRLAVGCVWKKGREPKGGRMGD